MDILESVSVLQIIYQIINLTPWTVDRKSWSMQRCLTLEIYSGIVIVCSSGLLLYGLFCDDDYMKTSVNEIGETVDFIQLVGIRMAHVVSITEALMRREDQKKFYDELKEIDKIFERSLNIDMDNRKSRRLTLKRGLLFLSVYMVSEFFILGTHLVTASNKPFYIYWIFYLLPLVVCGLRYFQMFSSIRVVKRRFEKLVNILNEINFQKFTTDHNKANNVAYPNIKGPLKSVTSSLAFMEFSLNRKNSACEMESSELKKLLVVRDLYNRLYGLTEILNHYFGISILINVGNDFISITSNCYWIFINFKNFGSASQGFLQIAGSTLWSVPHLLNVLVLAILCERTIKTTTNIALSLHRIQIDTLNDNQNSVIQQFSLQLLHQKISITAAGFFNIDCSLLFTIVAATTTYLIILIQFHLNEITS